MKKLHALMVVSALSFLFIQPSNAQTSVDVGLAYGTDIEELGLRFGVSHYLLGTVRVSGDFTYWLVGDREFFDTTLSTTAMELNGNLHYVFYHENNTEIYGVGSLGLHYIRTSMERPG